MEYLQKYCRFCDSISCMRTFIEKISNEIDCLFGNISMRQMCCQKNCPSFSRVRIMEFVEHKIMWWLEMFDVFDQFPKIYPILWTWHVALFRKFDYWQQKCYIRSNHLSNVYFSFTFAMKHTDDSNNDSFSMKKNDRAQYRINFIT